MKTQRTFLSLALLLSLPCALRAMDPAAEGALISVVPGSADGARAASPITTTGKNYARELELKTKLDEYQATLATRRASLKGHEDVLVSLAAAKAQLEAAQVTNQATHTAEIALLTQRKADLAALIAQRQALIDADEQTEQQRFDAESFKLAAEFLTNDQQATTVKEIVANRLTRIEEVESRELAAKTGIERLKQGLSEKPGILGFGFLGL